MSSETVSDCFQPTARKPAQRLCFFFVLWYFLGGLGGWVAGSSVLGLRCPSASVGHVLCPLVDAHHVTLDTSSVLQRTQFMLSWTRLLYFGRCTWITAMETLHVTLDMSSVWWMHFMLRWTQPLYSGGCTSCYIGHVFSVPHVDTVNVTLGTSCVLLGTHFMLHWDTSSVPHVDTVNVTLGTSCVLWWVHLHVAVDAWRVFCTSMDTAHFMYVGHVFCPSVDALHVTLDTSSLNSWECRRLRHHSQDCPQAGLKRKKVLAMWPTATHIF